MKKMGEIDFVVVFMVVLFIVGIVLIVPPLTKEADND